MRKLLIDFKKKIQESYFYYFHYIGSQKLCERHLKTIVKWQAMLESNVEMLENPNHKKVKRLVNNNSNKKGPTGKNEDSPHSSLENISFDCKLEILRRLNDGIDLINISQCNKSFFDIINKELAMWKNLCCFHFHQQHINQLLTKSLAKQRAIQEDESQPPQEMQTLKEIKSSDSNSKEETSNELDWKLIYFKLKKRYGHREIYQDMIYRCLYCKCLFW
jgi:hypothetical protein